MPADVGEGAKLCVLIADDEDRFAGDFRRQERTRFGDEIVSADGEPAVAEDGSAFGLIDVGVAIPTGGDGTGAVERQGGVERADLLGEGHGGAG